MKKIDLTREQLYELVREKPILHIVETYGGTYKEVKEMLNRYNIPMPENGYWSRVRSGYNIQKLPLPPMDDEFEKIIYQPRETKKRIKRKEQLSTTNVSDQIVCTKDSLVMEAHKFFQKIAKDRRDDQLVSISYQSLDINVSPKVIDRAPGFFNLLIIGVKRMGGEIKTEPRNHYPKK